MVYLRTAAAALLALPVLLVMLPVALLAPASAPPEIPAGVVTPTQPQDPDGLIGVQEAEFSLLGEVETGSVIDPFTGQPRTPVYVGVDGERITPDRIRRFLDRYASPMAPYARRIVAAGKRYGVDPRLIVAIAGTESSFGKFQKGHNAWGWDAPRGLTRWMSWEESIDGYTGLFATGYRNHDPRIVGPRYCPDCPSWPVVTRYFFSLI